MKTTIEDKTKDASTLCGERWSTFWENGGVVQGTGSGFAV